MAEKPHRPFPISAMLVAILIVPGLVMLWPIILGDAPYRRAIGPTGAMAAALLIFVLCLSPLRYLSPSSRWIGALVSRRRIFGLATFFYAAAHMVLFVLAIGRLNYILEGLRWASMWTGWLAFALLAVLAATSSERAARLAGRHWKSLHRLVYPAGLLALAHWMLLTPQSLTVLLWVTPLALLQMLRLYKQFGRRRRR